MPLPQPGTLDPTLGLPTLARGISFILLQNAGNPHSILLNVLDRVSLRSKQTHHRPSGLAPHWGQVQAGSLLGLPSQSGGQCQRGWHPQGLQVYVPSPLSTLSLSGEDLNSRRSQVRADVPLSSPPPPWRWHMFLTVPLTVPGPCFLLS